MARFVSGLELNERFYRQAVRPILAAAFPGLVYSAARIGPGSEVLGYDDAMSTDHDWGPGFQLFLSQADHAARAAAVDEALAARLPATFLGYSVHFAPPNEEGTRLMALPAGARVAHRVRVTTVGEFFQDTVGYTSGDAPAPIPPQPAEWLTFSQQHLLSVTAGRVFHDGLGTLAAVRQTLAFYPHDVWLYLLAAQWARIAQEEHLMGRCGYRGDELGSHLIGARLVNDLMRLCFLMARRYAPYPKWFGTAFAALPCARRMAPLLRQALAAADWRAREAALCQAYTLVAVLHNALGVTPPQETAVSYFHERPFRVSNAGPIIAALRAAIQDPAVRAIPTLIGGIDQFSHSTDLLEDPRLHPPLQALYEETP